MAIQVGQQLGNYKLIRLLGSGGFGEVYLGENISIGRQVAIKVLHGNFSHQAIQDFKNEARIIGQLKHPNIVPLLDFGELAGEFYMIMEYAANGTLEDRHSQGGPIPLVTIISYVKQIAEALQYAHDKKIVHRDIKPENIFIGQNYEIMVGDFGIAVIAHRTQTMQLQVPLGTPGYAAPEQAQGLARPASDQYALGIMVCEWLSGISPPFPAGIKIPGIAPAVEQVIFKAFENDPKQRYPRIEDFADALEQACAPPKQNIAAMPQNQPIAAPQPVAPPMQQPLVPDLNWLYKEGLKAQSVDDLERAAFLWQQVLQHNPNFQNGTLALLLRGLAPARIEKMMQQARAAKAVGDWQQEINWWYAVENVLSRWSNINYSVAERMRMEARKQEATARQNLQNQPLYEHTQQLLNNGNRDAAKATLKMLWQHAPFYGDPLGLAKKVGVLVPLDPSTKDGVRS